jgi:LemA protein
LAGIRLSRGLCDRRHNGKERENMTLWIILGVLAIGVLFLIGVYNSLVSKRVACQEGWSQIDVQLKRRHDLIPNLVETVKGYAAHEKTTLENVIQARNQAVQARGVPDQARAESELSSSLGRLMVVMEQYPDLKANQNFLALQEELSSTENKIGFSRQNYNDSVMEYNTRTQSFPANLIAGWGNFQQEAFFEIEDKTQREVPQVKF